MSKANIALIQEGFKAWNAGDIERVRDVYDPEAVMRYPPGFPEPGPFYGRDAIMRQFDRLRDSLDYRDSLIILTGPVSAGDRVLVRFAWRGTGYGPTVNLEMSVVYTIRHGRIREAEFFMDHGEALEVAGLQE